MSVTLSARRVKQGLTARLERHRAVVLTGICLYLTFVTTVPILFTPYRHDDIINQHTPEVLAASGASLPVALVRSIADYTERWAVAQGRFFPGSVAWTQTVFSVFRSRESYKLFLCVLAGLMIFLAAMLFVALTRQQRTAAVMIVALSATVTLRTWVDGLYSFAGLLPLTLCLAIGSTLLLLRGRGAWSVAAAVALWSFGLVTYEIIILLTPVVCLLVWLERRSLGRALALLWPTLADGILVLYLRSHATLVDPAYSIDLHSPNLLSTYVKQAGSALPLSQLWFPGAQAIHVPPGLAALAIPLVAVPAAVALLAALPQGPLPSRRALLLLALTGATLWLIPSALTAATARWQTEIPPGQGYLSVVWGYVGVAMLLAVAWLALVRWHRQSPGRLSRSALLGATGALSLVVALNAAQTLAIVSSFTFVAG